MEGNGRAGDGSMVGDGDATRHSGTAGDGLHAGARSFYSHWIGCPVGRPDTCSRRTSERYLHHYKKDNINMGKD